MRIPSSLIAALLVPLAGSLFTACYDTDGFVFDASVFGGGGVSGSSGQAGNTTSQGGAGSSQGGAGTGAGEAGTGAGESGQGGAAGDAAGNAGDAGNAGNAGESGNAGNAGESGNGGDSGGAGESGSGGDSGAAGAGGDAGQSGAAGNAGDSGAGGDSGAAGEAGVSGSSGQGGAGASGSSGQGGAGQGGAGTSGQGGAGTAGVGGAAGCANAVSYYPDTDHDNQGDKSASPTVFCSDPGADWSDNNLDCYDKDNRVFSGQTSGFSKGYPKLGNPGNLSFDFDCDGKETPTDAALQGVPACAGVNQCTKATGFAPTSRVASTTINSYCGSLAQTSCTDGSLITACGMVSKQTPEANGFACR